MNRRRSVVMTSFVKLLESMMNFKEDDSVLISRLNRAKLLIIDDLGAERGTDYALERVYDIIDAAAFLSLFHAVTACCHQHGLREHFVFEPHLLFGVTLSAVAGSLTA